MKHLIIGGTGTLGRAVVKELLTKDPATPIAILSRGELEQQKMRAAWPDLHYIIGDVKDRQSLAPAMRGVGCVYHFAALKHVDVVEANPMEAVRTNIEGTRNVATAALEAGVRHLVFSSTDKAVLPINTYGMTKAIAESYLLSLEGFESNVVYRWGNVVGSRGSAIPIFVRQILEGKPVTLTHAEMTRFWIRIETAARFVVDTSTVAGPKEVRIPVMGAAKVIDVIETIGEILGRVPHIEIIGIRPGEKIHECLHTSHEYCLNSNTATQYSRDELRALLFPTVDAEVRDAR